MFGFRSRPEKPEVLAGQALFEGAVHQARTPAFYRDMGVPDTVLGRFELYTLHVVLLARRLAGRGDSARATAQAMFDAYLLNLDIALREMGVGDLSMGKKMKKLGQAFYGRIKSWDEAQGDDGAARDLLVRTVYDSVAGPDAQPLTAYVRGAGEALNAQADDTLLQGRAEWPKVGA